MQIPYTGGQTKLVPMRSHFRDHRLTGTSSCFSFFIKTLPVQVIVCDISMVTTLRSKFAAAAVANQLDM